MTLPVNAEHMVKLLSRGSQEALSSSYRNWYVETDDFSSFDADDDYVVSNSLGGGTTGTADVIDGAFGILQIDSNSGTADQGAQVQHKTETILPAANKGLIFGCRLKVTDTISKSQIFAGLSILDTTMFDAGDNTSTDHIGFEMNQATLAAASGRVDFVAEKGGARTSVSTVTTLVEDTYIILEFYANGLDTITPLINGVGGTGITTGSTHTPTTEMAATFCCQSEGTDDPILSLDWYFIAQER